MRQRFAWHCDDSPVVMTPPATAQNTAAFLYLPRPIPPTGGMTWENYFASYVFGSVNQHTLVQAGVPH